MCIYTRLINDWYALLVSLQIDRNNYYCRNPLFTHMIKKDENNNVTLGCTMIDTFSTRSIDKSMIIIVIIITRFTFNNGD